MTLFSKRSTCCSPQPRMIGKVPNLELNSSFLDMDVRRAYNQKEIDIWMTLGAVFLAVLFSIACIAVGIYISLHQGPIGEPALPSVWRTSHFDMVPESFAGLVVILPAHNTRKTEMMSLALNLIVTACTESVGFVHSIALRSSLASEGRLHFNTNLRLFTASGKNRWTYPNSIPCNAIMAILLVMSYTSSSMVFITFQFEVPENSTHNWWSTGIFAPPVTVLGVTLLLQVITTLLGICRIRVLTWSSSVFDTTATLLRDGQLVRIPRRCMHSVVDATSYHGPRPPSERQPSAWQAHPNIKKIVIILWSLSLTCAAWGGIVFAAWVIRAKLFGHGASGAGLDSWAFLPNTRSNSFGFSSNIDPDHGFPSWAVTFIWIVMIQGFLTFGLHCSEVIVNIVRDEKEWRRATSTNGMRMARNPLVAVLRNWPNVVLLISKPVLRRCHPLIRGDMLIQIGRRI